MYIGGDNERESIFSVEEEYFTKEIEPKIFEQYKHPGCNPWISHYKFFCAILYVLRTGV